MGRARGFVLVCGVRFSGAVGKIRGALDKFGRRSSNMNKLRVTITAAACLMAIGLCSCSTLRFGKGGAPAAATAAEVVPVVAATSEADRERELLRAVQQVIDNANSQPQEQREAVERRRPYFFKAYDIYPGSAANAEFIIQRQDSRSMPYVADVTLEKQRFATRLHRNRQDAADDNKFIRATGTETITFEYRSGRWQRAGAMFIAEKREQRIDGEWVAVVETERPEWTTDEDRGWFGRAWSRITGG